MFRTIRIRKSYLLLGLLIILAASAGFLFDRYDAGSPVSTNESENINIQLVTGEFQATADGKKLEAYRWDPGTVHVKKGNTVNLSIRGVSGMNHPFIIEGLNIKGEVKQGQTTTVSFKAEKAGTYKLVCLTHTDATRNGPMVGYIVVD